jgi:hypothetical protein
VEPAVVTVTIAGVDTHRYAVRRRMVGDLGDPGERHLPGRRLGQRRGREPGSVAQQLTINTVLPVITIDGGPSVTTNAPDSGDRR